MTKPNAIASASADKSEKAVTPVEKLISTEQYADIKSFDDALSLVQDVFGGEVVSADELGDGFTVLDNKMSLIGAEFLVLSAAFYVGDIKREDGSLSEFVSLRIVAKDGRKLIVNDGGSGIYAQVKMLHDKKPQTVGKPLYVKKGLRVSQYDHPQYGKSETFYLDTSAS